jgi:hypothetical protein
MTKKKKIASNPEPERIDLSENKKFLVLKFSIVEVLKLTARKFPASNGQLFTIFDSTYYNEPTLSSEEIQ